MELRWNWDVQKIHKVHRCCSVSCCFRPCTYVALAVKYLNAFPFLAGLAHKLQQIYCLFMLLHFQNNINLPEFWPAGLYPYVFFKVNLNSLEKISSYLRPLINIAELLCRTVVHFVVFSIGAVYTVSFCVLLVNLFSQKFDYLSNTVTSTLCIV